MKKTPKQKLIEKLDSVFQRYVRYRDSGKCFTCGVIIDPSNTFDLHGGHLFSRQFKSTRWHEDNCFAQCRGCNYRQDLIGNGSAVLKVIDMIGEQRVRAVEQKTRDICKVSVYDLEELIEKYEEKLERLKQCQ